MTARPTVNLTVGMGTVPATGTDIAASAFRSPSGVVKSITCTRGRNRILDSINPGSLTAQLDNARGEFDPFNTAGPFTTAGVTQVMPGPFIQLACTGGVLGGATSYIWSGFLIDLASTWSVGEFSTATWTASEALIALGRVNPVALTTAVGDAELSGARIARILTNASWPVTTSVFPPFGASRALDGGVTNLQTTTLGTNALQEAQSVALTERGDFYCDGQGRMVFHNRGYRFLQRNGSTNATFGDGGGSEIPFVEGSQTIANNVDLYRNTAHIGAPGLTTQTSTVAGPFVSDYPQTSLYLRDNGEALTYANWITATYAGGDPRIASITVQPTDDDANWATLLALDIGQWVTVKVRPPALKGAIVQRECFIEGISHTINADGQDPPWTIRFDLGDATPFAGPWFVLDDATFGKLDSGNKLIF